MDMLAHCGATTGVLLSTCGRLDGCAPRSPPVHGSSPGHPPAVPSPYPGRKTWSARYAAPACGSVGKPQVERGIDGARRRVEAMPRASTGTGVPGPPGTPRSRDLPNLCTFLGTTSRPVDAGHRPKAPRYAAMPVHRRGPLIHRPVDKSTDEATTVRVTGRQRAGVDRSRGPGGAPDRGHGQRLNAAGERQLDAVRSGGPRCHCLARLLMRAVSSVTWV